MDIYNVFDPNIKPAPGTSVALTYTKLATVPAGAIAQQVQNIENGSHLEAMVTGNIAGLNNNYYQQFPLAVLAISQFAVTLAFTLTSDMQQSMVDSFQFIKYMQANPSTALATGFRGAMAQKQNTEAIDTFFKGTGSFQQCTYSTWNSVFTWQSQFTSPWQGTYYLYSTGSSSADSSGTNGTNGSSADGTAAPTTTPTAPTLVATLAITASADDSSAVLTMAAQGGQSTPVAMPGDGSMQEKGVGTGNLSVSINPVWLNVVQKNRKTGDSFTVIGAAFAGTINNAQVAGGMNKIVIPSIPSTSPTFGSVMSSICDYSNKLSSLIGSLVGIATLSIMFKDSKAAERQRILDAQKEAKNEADAKAKELKIKEESDAKFQAQLSQKGPAIEKQASTVSNEYDEVTVAKNVQKDMMGVVEEGQKLEGVLQNGAGNADISKTANNLGKAVNELGKADQPGTSVTEAQKDLNQVDKTIEKTSENLNNEVQSEGKTASQDETKAQSDVKKVDNEVEEQAKETKEVKQEEETQDKASASEDVNKDQFKNEEEGGEGKDVRGGVGEGVK